MTDKQNIEGCMWQAVSAAIPAGKAILKVYDTHFKVSTKADSSPLTLADMESHRIISEKLRSTGIPVLSEEGKDIPYPERRQWPQFWLVDPLDGTKEFVKRNGDFTVNIALIKDAYPLAGVIYVPVSDVLYVGIQYLGSYRFTGAAQLFNKAADLQGLLKTGTRLPDKETRDIFTVVCSRSHMSTETEAYIDELREEFGEVDFASRGSSLKLCMVAEGEADVYPRFAPTMEWDTAAGQAIAECAGAVVVDAENNERLQYNKENLLNPWFIVSR